MKKTTRQQEVISMREEIKNYQTKIKQQRKTINTLLDYSLSKERHKDGIVSQITETSITYMEIYEQTLDGIERLNKFVSKMKYTNRRLLNTLTQLMDNTAFAIYNHEQLLRTVSQHISNGGKDSAHNGKHITQNGKDIVHGENGSAYNGNGVANANGKQSHNRDKQNRKLINH